VDKLQGNEREVVGKKITPSGQKYPEGYEKNSELFSRASSILTKGNSPYEHLGTAVKPAHEPICMARKPLSEKTVAKNVLKHGTGGINIDGCRVGTKGGETHKGGFGSGIYGDSKGVETDKTPLGRFPANLILEKSYILLLTLKENCDRLKAQVIKQYYENYEVPTMWERVPSISEPDEERAEKVLLKGMLLQSPEKLSISDDGETSHQGDDREDKEKSAHDEGKGQSKIQGLVLQQGIQTHKSDRVEQKGTRNSNPDDQQGGDSRTQDKGGDKLGETIEKGRDSSSQERSERRQQDRKLGDNKQYKSYCTSSQTNKGKPEIEILTGDVPEAWLRYFRPTGYSIVNPESSAKALDEQSGELGKSKGGNAGVLSNKVYGKYATEKNNQGTGFGDKGGASRFFYCAKASKGERNAGCEGLEEKDREMMSQMGQGNTPQQTAHQNKPQQNFHPTVKPISLMRYLCRLVTPKGGIILDPFLGSGTTGIGAIMEGFGFVGIEKEKDYIKIAEARMSHWNKKKEEEMRQEVLL